MLDLMRGIDLPDAALEQIVNRSHDDTDAGIEDFNGTTGLLVKVTPEEAYARYPGQISEARRALASVIEHADRGVAHLSTGPDQAHGRTIERFVGGSEAVFELTQIHFCDPLTRARHDLGIRSVKLVRVPKENASMAKEPPATA